MSQTPDRLRTILILVVSTAALQFGICILCLRGLIFVASLIGPLGAVGAFGAKLLGRLFRTPWRQGVGMGAIPLSLSVAPLAAVLRLLEEAGAQRPVISRLTRAR